MDKESLVTPDLTETMILAGADVLKLLDAEGFLANGCFWFFLPEQERWRLYLASPLIKKQGFKNLYIEIQNILSQQPRSRLPIRIDDISIIDEKDSLAKILEEAWIKRSGYGPVMIKQETFDSNFVAGAYIYRLKASPRSTSVSKKNKRDKIARPSVITDTRIIYCGDNLEQLQKLPSECVDLIYIDPPFNSNRNYEIFWGESKEKRAFEDRHASTQAYIDYMRPRCMALARVLKKTGSFYYHCDWHASHYVKVMLDQIFGENNFQNEIVWKRSSAHSDSKRYGANHDTIFFYTGGANKWTWNKSFTAYDPEYVEQNYRYKDEKGMFRVSDMTANKPGGDVSYEWTTPDGQKVKPYKGRYWAYSKEKMQQMHDAGQIYYRTTGMPMLKHYIDEMPGVPLQTFWDDIKPLISGSDERLGYPTQKPLALLERIVQASSNENDIVLDAFCGCGTALVAAQSLKRQWIGIDISPTACRVMAKRLRDVCGIPESEPLWKNGRGFVVRDLPWTVEKLRAIPPFEFENWAVIALGGIPNKVQVGDMGIDGRIFPVSASAAPRKRGEGELALQERWYPIQVKQKDKVGRPDIDAFEAVMMREDCEKGFFISFDFSSDALSEIQAFFKRTHKVIVPLTVQEILDEQVAMKLV